MFSASACQYIAEDSRANILVVGDLEQLAKVNTGDNNDDDKNDDDGDDDDDDDDNQGEGGSCRGGCGGGGHPC